MIKNKNKQLIIGDMKNIYSLERYKAGLKGKRAFFDKEEWVFMFNYFDKCSVAQVVNSVLQPVL